MTLIKHNQVLQQLYLLKSIGYKYINEHNSYISQNKNLQINDINKLKDIVLNCNLCSIGNLCHTRIFDKGNCQSDIVFITQKVFKQNNIYNLFLELIKESLNFNIEDICIVNILKCDIETPLDNYTNELDICKDYAVKQIELLKPKVIIALGDTYKYFTNKKNMTNGSMFRYNHIDLFVSDEPEYILRNPSIREDTIIYYTKIKQHLEKT
jgi:DNA polymerase